MVAKLERMVLEVFVPPRPADRGNNQRENQATPTELPDFPPSNKLIDAGATPPWMDFQYWPTTVKSSDKAKANQKGQGLVTVPYQGRELREMSMSVFLDDSISPDERHSYYDETTGRTFYHGTTLSPGGPYRVDSLALWSVEQRLYRVGLIGVEDLKYGTREFFSGLTSFSSTGTAESIVMQSLSFLIAATGRVKIFGEYHQPTFTLFWSRSDPFLCHVQKVDISVVNLDPNCMFRTATVNVKLIQATESACTTKMWWYGKGGPESFNSWIEREDGAYRTFPAD